MEIKDYHYNQGLTETVYKTDRAQLDGFSPVEADWKELFRWLMSSGYEITKVWENHAMCVLVEMVQKDLEEYRHSFAIGRGTRIQMVYANKLKDKIARWIERLEYYLMEQRKGGLEENAPEIQAALQMKDELEEAISPKECRTDEQRAYYQMIDGMKNICKNSDRYVKMIESGGNMDAALSLLLTYVRNYCTVVDVFNRKINGLPVYYRREILQTVPEVTQQDKTYLIIKPTVEADSFSLHTETAFLAGSKEDGTDLLYRTFKEENITSLVIEDLFSVLLSNQVLYKQPLKSKEINTAMPLFPTMRTPPVISCGWMIESHMLVLEEGNREVKIHFTLSDEGASAVPMVNAEHFALWISTEDGWTKLIDYSLNTIGSRLSFGFRLAKDTVAPVACTEETHSITTQTPALRILTESPCPYEALSELHVTDVKIEVEVTDIQDFTFYNELGELNTTQAFYPFGAQAEWGAWFMFGNKEIGLKHLEEVRLNGKWQKLPPQGFTELYKAYPYKPAITEKSFRIQTEYQKNGDWLLCAEGINQPLFQKSEGKNQPNENLEISFRFETLLIKASPYEYNRDRNGYFRVTLQDPEIGFGMNAYRDLFTRNMIHNSRCKEKNQKEIPSEPVIPMLTDVKLSYKASDSSSLTDNCNSSIRLSRITPLAAYNTLPTSSEKDINRFLPDLNSGNLLYWSFSHAEGVKNIQMYVDLVLPESAYQNLSEARDPLVLKWDYLTPKGWAELSTEAILKEETNGFTQSGFIHISLPTVIHAQKKERLWIRTSFEGSVSQCLAIRNVWLNCIPTVAEDGNGLSLPAKTIQKTQQADKRIESIYQPLNGFGGKAAEKQKEVSIRQSTRIATRQRAVWMKDYERLLLEHFPEVERACCFPTTEESENRTVHLVVFSRIENFPYFLTPSWKLTEMERVLSNYISPFVVLRVINPSYCPIDVSCTAFLKSDNTDVRKVTAQLRYIITNYIAGWMRKATLPELDTTFSCKGMHSRIANHESIKRMTSLTFTFNGKAIEYQNSDNELLLKIGHPWDILIPGTLNIQLFPSTDGVNEGKIGKNFKIG